MKIFGYEISFIKAQDTAVLTEPSPVESEPAQETTQPGARVMAGYGDGSYSGTSVAVFSRSFDGEKTPGELGIPVNLVHDHMAIRTRAYQTFGTNNIIRTVASKYFKWVCGNGLKLQSEPNGTLLGLEGCQLSDETLTDFANNVEAYWLAYVNSTHSDHSGMYTLNQNSLRSYTTSFIGGDVLNVLRLDDKFNVTVQVIDAQHVRQPLLQGSYFQEAKERGNIIRNGIEMDPTGKHVAFYVIKKSDKNILGEFERIEAVSQSTGCLMAWMNFADKARIDNDRGISRITTILELVTKLDRYTEASVASAEERSKVPWTVEHNQFSDGSDPLMEGLKTRMGGKAVANEDPYVLGEAIAKKIAVTEEKSVYNLPIGSQFKAVDSKSEIQYDPFFSAIFKQVCSAIDVPPEVALQQYSSNYSASRAAINGWGYIIDIEREEHARNFYQKVFNLWLYVHVLTNKVKAPGYLKAVNEGNWRVVESYSKARFTGANMPHIDPKKEADAIRVMLGDDTTPLMTNEQATEQLGNGSFAENIKKIAGERKQMKKVLPDQVAGDADGSTKKSKKKPADAVKEE